MCRGFTDGVQQVQVLAAGPAFAENARMKRSSPFLSIGDVSMLIGIAMALGLALLWGAGAH